MANLQLTFSVFIILIISIYCNIFIHVVMFVLFLLSHKKMNKYLKKSQITWTFLNGTAKAVCITYRSSSFVHSPATLWEVLRSLAARCSATQRPATLVARLAVVLRDALQTAQTHGTRHLGGALEQWRFSQHHLALLDVSRGYQMSPQRVITANLPHATLVYKD